MCFEIAYVVLVVLLDVRLAHVSLVACLVDAPVAYIGVC